MFIPTVQKMPAIDDQSPLIASCLSDATGQWQTTVEYEHSGLIISPVGFASATNVLLAQPNLNSSHLFRADILYDSAKQLKTPTEHENDRGLTAATERCDEEAAGRTPETFAAFTLTRTVIRRLIPRNAQLDRPMIQSCHIYEAGTLRHLVVYSPHVDNAEATPWYHPPVKSLAYLYEAAPQGHQDVLNVTVSVHFLPFEGSRTVTSVPTRLHRTLLSLLNTLVRLARSMSRPRPENTMNVALAPKDNIAPQHCVQNTYARLKQKYATDLINGWVEKTEPSKHVFEDLSIAAFLIELWRQMYGVQSSWERLDPTVSKKFPGFVDIACGNGVLVYVLLKEGYKGWGFDARRRRTWDTFPEDIQEHILERMLVPGPYLRTKAQASKPGDPNHKLHEKTKDLGIGVEYHDGIFEEGTFIISNHADELTPWTPILAALSNPANPLPWLAIPCCSHALSGVKHRYPVLKSTSLPKTDRLKSTLARKESSSSKDTIVSMPQSFERDSKSAGQSHTSAILPGKPAKEQEQPVNGDLKALRAAKAKAASGADQSSTYACLTAKVVALAEELGTDTERTLMRIPSTRNIGIIGGRDRVMQKLRSQTEGRNGEHEVAKLLDRIGEFEIADEAGSSGSKDATVTIIHDKEQGDGSEGRSGETMLRMIDELIERECKASGGVDATALIWMEGAKSLQTGQGRGKVNFGRTYG